MKLVIVESPAKCKKIMSFLGKGYLCLASYGHIRDLERKKLSIDIANNYTPNYVIMEEKRRQVSALKQSAKKATEVIIASDLDREGEAIGYHVMAVLNLDPNKTKRIVFHSITKKAILEAMKNPRKIDKKLFDAQQARRIIDRLMGFQLSPLLWKYVQSHLSAGRCQTVALRAVYERSKVIEGFKYESSFKLTGKFKYESVVMDAKYSKSFKTVGETRKYLEKCKEAIFKIVSISSRDGVQNPPPPFITSSLQQEASNILHFSPKRTMMVAQKLYEKGKITYMRTDSFDLSKDAVDDCIKCITDKYGKKYLNPQKYSSKKKTQEAHEAVRPVHCDEPMIKGTDEEQKLYGLIWRRCLASQMASLLKKVHTVKISQSNTQGFYKASAEEIIFDGFKILYSKKEKDSLVEDIKKMKEGTIVKPVEITGLETWNAPKTRFTEASLIKELEKKGVGRPSTFSAICTTNLTRNYVIKDTKPGVEKIVNSLTLKNKKITEKKITKMIGVERNRLCITELGKVVYEFMSKHFPNLFTYEFTSEIENELDKIAAGRIKWQTVVDRVYKSYHEIVDKLSDKKQYENFKEQEKRKIGTYRKKDIIVYRGRYGPVAKMEDTDPPRYVSIPDTIPLDKVKLKDVLPLFKYPREIGTYNRKPMLLQRGRYGIYITHNEKNYSIPPEKYADKKITEVIAKEIIKEKNKSILKDWGEISIRKGKKDSIYILKKTGGRPLFVSLDKDVNLDKITEKHCEKLCKDYIKNKGKKKPIKSKGKGKKKKPVKRKKKR